MKNIITFIIIFSIIISVGCHKRDDDSHSFYEDYDRRIGPEGGELVFFRNYTNDWDKIDTLLKMIVPENAVDTTIIINFYKYNNTVLTLDIYNEFNLLTSSDFFYIMPFYNFINTNDSTSNYKRDQHLSIDFNYPVTFTYYIDTAKFAFLETSDKLYRIKTPRNNEWAYEIWTKFNKQGYPNGFDETDLFLLINGKWNKNDIYAEGDYSMINWEEVPNYTINPENHSVTFVMDKTDYIYIICYSNKKKIRK